MKLLEEIESEADNINIDSELFNIDSWDFTDDKLFLSEDLLQANYSIGNDNVILDFGFYGTNLKGNFIVQVIKNYDWENPIFVTKFSDKNKIYDELKEGLRIIKNL